MRPDQQGRREIAVEDGVGWIDGIDVAGVRFVRWVAVGDFTFAFKAAVAAHEFVLAGFVVASVEVVISTL
jgi:hypothetical protein